MKAGFQSMVLAGAFLVIGGCVTPPVEPDMLISQVHPTPICAGEDQCAQMWGRAVKSISIVTSMRVMAVTE